MRLQVVHVGALAVVGDADRVAGTVDEGVAEARLADEFAGGVVHLEAPHGLVREAAAHQVPGGVAAAGHDVENLLLAVGGRGVADADPGDVRVDARGRLLLGPQVDEQEIALADGRGAVRPGLVMRIGAVGVDAHDGVRLGPQAGMVEGVQDEALDGVFVDLVALPQGVGHTIEGFEGDAVEVHVGAPVPGELLVAPGGGEALGEVGGRHQLDTRGPHQLGRAGVQARDRGKLVVGAVLGRQPGEAGDQLRQFLPVFLPGEVAPISSPAGGRAWRAPGRGRAFSAPLPGAPGSSSGGSPACPRPKDPGDPSRSGRSAGSRRRTSRRRRLRPGRTGWRECVRPAWNLPL